ncbi:MAG: hypothetical protein LBE35_10045 [Clostridiales bacterium]|jgi:hypothetical protein|nr:hypothetical protein [Clostridiales bacterium]
MGSKEIATVSTVFMYRINVALASILIFINIQLVVAVFIVAEATPRHVATNIILLALALLYGIWAFNGMAKKFIIYPEGLEYRALLARRFIANEDIKRVEFLRRDDARLRITLHFSEGRPMVINAGAFKDNKPLVDFCAKFERG